MSAYSGSQRALKAAAAFALAELVSRSADARELRLLVFLHVALKQRAFQSELQAALPTLTVKTVGRLADFERGLEEGQDAVLSHPLLLTMHGLVPRLQGMRAGVPDEKYALVGAPAAHAGRGAGGPPDPKSVASVGTLDLLGREATNSFVYELLGSKPRVERVTKIEDLLPLLQMQRVDSVLVPMRLLTEVKASSRLVLAQRELAGLVKLPAVASTGPGGPETLAAVAKLPEKITRTLGVDAWR